MTEIQLGKFTITGLKEAEKRLTMLLWGSSGCGKTVLASTAPGKKLWINLDPGGTDSLAGNDDILVLDLVSADSNIVEEFKRDDPLGISKLFETNPEIETVVFDSATTYKEKIHSYAVRKAQSTAKGKSSTLEDPGFSGYGNINTWIRQTFENLLRITAKYNKHIIFICHEDTPTKDDNGVVQYISIMLGSNLNEQVPIKISETWWLNDTGKERKIAIRPCRMRKPMRTRMFDTTGPVEFVWNYNQETGDGDTIEKWFNEWKETNKKLKVPK